MKLLLSLAAFALFVGVHARLGTDDNNNARKLEVDIADVFADMMDDAADASEKLRELTGKYGGGEMKEYDYGSMMSGTSGGKQFNLTKIMEAFSKDVNYTDLYHRCCSSLDEDMPSSYDMTRGADTPKEEKSCKCPIRESDKVRDQVG